MTFSLTPQYLFVMAVTTKKKNATQKEPAKAPGRSQSAGRSRSQSEFRQDDQRQKVLNGFHPSVIDWFKKNLSVDLASPSFKLSDLYRLQRNELTDPITIVVTPLAYDATKKENVEMPRISANVSLRVNLPMEGGKPVAVDDDHRIFLQTVPCRPLVELAAPGEAVTEKGPADNRETKFSDAQILALEGIGISRERLYGGFNHLSRQEKLDILDGEIFPVEGNVKTDFGFVNVIGEARMRGTGDDVTVAFEPSFPEKRENGLVIDLERARIIGSLELDFFKRTPDNKVMLDGNKAPILNSAGENILEFGASLEPVKGYLHKRERVDGVWKDSPSVAWYNVKVVNGSLYAQKMLEKEVKQEDGTSKTVLEVPAARIKDGAVYVSGETKPLAFASEADQRSFLEGRGGVVKDASFKDFKTNKTSVYNAFVYAKENGMAEKFSPAATERILGRKAEQNRKTTNRRKVRFGRGL